ncbi:MAG TPA: glycosyltransferase family 87 protein [Verrucomicrobiae bacterium]|nr:glycosyltransferase family 87 protein [Verrucomicrobiae bacterium]
MWRSPVLAPVLAVGAAVIALIHVVWIVEMLPSRAFAPDFDHYYITSRLLWEGQNPYRTPATAGTEKPVFLRPEVATSTPVSLWLWVPMAMLAQRPAFWLRVAIEAVSLVAVLWLTRHLLKGQLSERGWWFLCAGFVSSSPVLWHFAFSPENLTLTAALLAAYAWHKAGKEDRACWLVLLAGLVKMYPLAFLPWFIWRSKRPMWKRLRTAAALALGAGAIVLVTGPGLWADFYEVAPPIIRWWAVGHTFNFTLSSFVINLAQALRSGTASVEPGRGLWMTGSSIGLAAVAAAYLFCVTTDGDEDLQFSLLCAATLTVYGCAYYFVQLIFPVGLAAARLAASSSWRRLLVFSALLIATNSEGPWDKSFWGGSPLLMILLNYLPLYGLIGFCFFLVRERNP